MSIFSDPLKVFDNIIAWWKGTSIGSEIDAAGKATLTELEAIAPGILQSVTTSTATALLTGITSGGATADIIAAGIKAAENGFKAAETSVASTTISTFVSTLHNSVVTQAAVPATASSSSGASA